MVEYQERDRYQRILGKVVFNGEDINLEQITSGMAWHYKKYQGEQLSADRIRYSDAELEARREKRGLWHAPEPVPPWEYRQAKRDHMKSMVPVTGSKSMVNDGP